MKKRLINDQITEQKLLVIDKDGNKLGILSRDEALNKAYDQDLDLVLIAFANHDKPAIAKIVDYGKMLYEEKTKQRESRKKQNVTKVKEIKVRPQVGDNDLKWMAKNAISWLEDGNQVKFKIAAYGRMGFKPEVINGTYEKFLGLLGPIAKIQIPLKKLTPVLYEATIVKNKQ
ncbi:MAG: translation initiation factor IF-3 [Mycoplasma sp.]